MRITRRDFLKFCAMSAGALGLTTTDLGKLEKALATEQSDGGTKVVWINGAACTGCTVSFANTMFFSSVQDLLVPWAKIQSLVPTGKANGPLDLNFIETLSSAVGQTALEAGEASMTNAGNFVLCIEGAIPTASGGHYCTVGDNFSGGNVRVFEEEVVAYATSAKCAAIVAVGTCASFGGIPAAKGSVTEAKGLISTGRITGGYQTVNTIGLWDHLLDTADYEVAYISMSNMGSGYTAATVTISGGGGSGALATATITGGQITGITVSPKGTGYTSAPTVSITSTTGTGAAAIAHIGLIADSGITQAQWTSLMAKTVCISGCPPHPDWLVGTIVYVLTYGEPPLMDKYHRPFDFYQEYQCTNCLWKTNNPTDATLGTTHDIDGLGKASVSGRSWGDSPKLFKYKYDSQYEGCIGVLGCKGRKTKADCSYRRWNTNNTGQGGVGWCVQTRAGCHGCTDPRYPDGWGKFFSFV